MVIQRKILSVDDVWDMAHHPDNVNKHYELIEGELFVMDPPGRPHGKLAARIARLLGNYVEDFGLGEVTVESGYHPPERRDSVLSPDVAFVKRERVPDPEPQKYTPIMPDLAVEILSPSNSLIDMRRKATVYLQNGAQIVWIVRPADNCVEVCRLGEDGSVKCTVVDSSGPLSGEDVLPGFELQVSVLLSP